MTQYTISHQTLSSIISVLDSQSEKIFEVTHDGKVVWHAEDQATDASRIFCESLQLDLEHKVGIRKRRKEWEEEHRNAIKRALREGTLDEAKVDEIFDRLAFHERLKGDATN